jgi:hypothetical protein
MEPGFQPRTPQPRTGMDVAKEYGNVSYRMIQLFRETKPWARFVGVYSLVMAGVLFLFAMLCAYAAVAGDAPAAIMLSAAVFYVVVALLSLFWGYFANQYASSIGSIEAQRGRAIEAALSHQKSVWRMMGVLAALSAVLVVGSVLLSVLFGVGAMLLGGEQRQAGTGAAGRSFWEKLILPDPFSELDAKCNLPDPDFLCLVQEDGSVKALRKPGAGFSIIESRRFRAFWVSPGKWEDGQWEFMFEGPSGQALEVGPYEDARWEVARGEHFPGLRIAHRGAVCPSATGRFRVLEISGSRFVADFEQVCAGTGERLFGRLAVAGR